MINKFFTWGKKKEVTKEEECSNSEKGKSDDRNSNENLNEVAKINFNNEVKFEKTNLKK